MGSAVSLNYLFEVFERAIGVSGKVSTVPRTALRTRLIFKTMSRAFWIQWLRIVLVVVLAYALFLVFAGTFAGSLFSALGFGPSNEIDNDQVRSYLRFTYVVLGAVLAGWALMMLQLVNKHLKVGATWVVPLMSRSLALWFVLDTGMSLVLGYPTHALFNLTFGIALVVPLLKLRHTQR